MRVPPGLRDPGEVAGAVPAAVRHVVVGDGRAGRGEDQQQRNAHESDRHAGAAALPGRRGGVGPPAEPLAQGGDREEHPEAGEDQQAVEQHHGRTRIEADGQRLPLRAGQPHPEQPGTDRAEPDRDHHGPSPAEPERDPESDRECDGEQADAAQFAQRRPDRSDVRRAGRCATWRSRPARCRCRSRSSCPRCRRWRRAGRAGAPRRPPAGRPASTRRAAVPVAQPRRHGASSRNAAATPPAHQTNQPE